MLTEKTSGKTPEKEQEMKQAIERLKLTVHNDFPFLGTQICDVRVPGTGEYVYSFIGLHYQGECFATVDNDEKYNLLKSACLQMGTTLLNKE